jgi:hypothetical protein
VAAALAARSECELLDEFDEFDEFDATGAIRFWTDLRSVAHWLGWACSMAPGVAREHVRVARALRRMPAVRQAFRDSGEASTYGTTDALLDVARSFLTTAAEDRSGEDRHLVVVRVAAEHLAGGQMAGTDSRAGDVPAGTPDVEPAPGPPVVAEDVPAGTSPPGSGAADPVCHVEGVGPIEVETARRLSCDASPLGAVVDAHGSVLALGRTTRLVSRPAAGSDDPRPGHVLLSGLPPDPAPGGPPSGGRGPTVG